jgi:predicted lipoprotein with Yx(FWY)xxD motif
MERRTTAVLAAVAGLVLLAAAIGPAAFGAAYTVDTAAIMVKGVSTKVLTDAKGMTLYYVASDTPTTSSCTDGCAKIWPPLLSTSAPATEEPLPGKLALVKTANGSQVSYNGHLLYVYSGDSAPHQANGQGVAGKWWVAKVDLKPAAAGGSGQPKPSNSGYGNGGW